MKVGIITFHRAINFGAVLQAYALQETLRKYTNEVYIIDYRNDAIENNYRIYNKKGNEGLTYRIIRIIGTFPIKAYKLVGFRRFLRKNLSFTRSYTRDTIKNINAEGFDIFITGSDQVFCPSFVSYDKNYLLNFAGDKHVKASYAASLGQADVDDSVIQWLSNDLTLFNHISVREQSAVKKLGECMCVEVDKHVDPVFLLGYSKWRSRIKNNNYKHKYILIFTICNSEEVVAAAKKFANEYDYDIVRINTGRKKRVAGIHEVIINDPDHFLTYFYYAQVIFTSSFHGTAFSIIFHKEFYVDTNLPNGKSDRMIELLGVCGVSGRSCKEYIDTGNAESIDWNSVDCVIRDERNYSEQYINNVLSNISNK